MPLAAGSGDDVYLEAWVAVEHAVRRFEPELVLVSAGFDAHVDDPLADMEVTAAGFRELARRSIRQLRDFTRYRIDLVAARTSGPDAGGDVRPQRTEGKRRCARRLRRHALENGTTGS